MPCIGLPLLPIPTLLSPLTLGLPALPRLGPIDLTLCCHIHIPLPPLPYPLNKIPPVPPLVFNLAVISAVIFPLIDEVNQFLALIALDCPVQ